ncbi:MAG: hypothetical protein EGR98_10645, partial [Prevotella sp.]|nr:hypothetical protein [Prevotella sp.]
MRKAKSNAMLRGLASTALVLLISATAWGQKMKITGTVIDNTNEPIIGASVLENGTQNGVATDLDGHFTIEVQQGAKLKISYIGYKTQEIPVGNGGKKDITLQDDSELMDEVVVIGYGTQRKGDVTSAVASVKAEDFTAGKIGDAAELIKGKVAEDGTVVDVSALKYTD